MLRIGQRAHSGRIRNVTVLVYPSLILISNNALSVTGRKTKSMVSNKVKVSLPCDNPSSKLPFELLGSCFRRQEAAWICTPCLSSIIQFLHNIIDHILGWRYEDLIQRKVYVANRHRLRGPRRAIGLLAKKHDAKKRSVVTCHCRLYPSSSGINNRDWGSIMGVRSFIPIRLLPAAPKLSDFLVGVSQSSNCSINQLTKWTLTIDVTIGSIN